MLLSFSFPRELNKDCAGRRGHIPACSIRNSTVGSQGSLALSAEKPGKCSRKRAEPGTGQTSAQLWASSQLMAVALGSHRELNLAHKAELSELENSYREALKIEKSVAQGKLGTVGTGRTGEGAGSTGPWEPQCGGGGQMVFSQSWGWGSDGG